MLIKLLKYGKKGKDSGDSAKPNPKVPKSGPTSSQRRSGRSATERPIPRLDRRQEEGQATPQRYLRDISNEKELVDNIIESAISILLSGKKLAFVFDPKLKGLERRMILCLLKKLEMLKKKEEFAKYLGNLVFIPGFDKDSERITDLSDLANRLKESGIDVTNARNNAVFIFTPSTANIPVSGEAVNTVLVENDKGFDISAYYYPIVEIVAITLAKYVKEYTKSDIYAIFSDYAKYHNLQDTENFLGLVNIESVDDGANGEFLIFRLLPKPRRMLINEDGARENILLQVINSAA